MDWVAKRFAFCLAVVLRPKDRKGFSSCCPAAGWSSALSAGSTSRRLSKSYERLTGTDESRLYIALTRIMLERLA